MRECSVTGFSARPVIMINSKMSLCNSYGWVPACKMMFHSMKGCHACGGFARRHMHITISTCHLYVTCWAAPCATQDFMWQYKHYRQVIHGAMIALTEHTGEDGIGVRVETAPNKLFVTQIVRKNSPLTSLLRHCLLNKKTLPMFPSCSNPVS